MNKATKELEALIKEAAKAAKLERWFDKDGRPKMETRMTEHGPLTRSVEWFETCYEE